MGTLSKSGTVKADLTSTSTAPIMEETKIDLGKLQEAELESNKGNVILTNPETADSAQFTIVDGKVVSNGGAEMDDASKGDTKNEVVFTSVSDSEVTANMCIESNQDSCLKSDTKDDGITSDAEVIMNPAVSKTAPDTVAESNEYESASKCNSPLPATGPEPGKQELEVVTDPSSKDILVGTDPSSKEVEAAMDPSGKEVEVAIDPNEEVAHTVPEKLV